MSSWSVNPLDYVGVFSVVLCEDFFHTKTDARVIFRIGTIEARTSIYLQRNVVCTVLATTAAEQGVKPIAVAAFPGLVS